ncbi:hypothetical protein IO99_02450 [Clostridium sulfidigenes]|uniref:Uncharacterized protein n=1 Tax=Clostridium sulfidigenes TaxID=318464 RepID=A0A084JHT0_9CLOT|nr:hypothetical protein [Clostridium sulfidigenes]KEZ88514.1 hypothetical protein IO99_02450 [Clostridium sulfidigenes]
MNKNIKFNKSNKLYIDKYIKIGKKARGMKKYILEDGRIANYIEFDNIGLEFIINKDYTCIRDIKNEVNLHEQSRFEDYQKSVFVLMGYFQTHKSR